MLREINQHNDLTSYAKWTAAYKETTMETEDKQSKQYREYISEKTKWLIEETRKKKQVTQNQQKDGQS